ncbi:3-carboxy-cis,cis-muconate cycloisomerase [Palleronia sp. LCG004]|uniref:3-carboxy-cis,cis-muconate cycloisomerase n=1 Tax=Palleronia sp. LCG004 TaxID=3079304 RepID=UPI002941F15A|nr:3-carboxy-cis,cis-muconate cycloisomerase [Palleronia sp. LCG004]WOI57872.1 3-carboxy-cis,cis-muconate cycloisomerase [Palleronia sp. LCG004]
MISVFDHPWLGGLFGDAAAQAIWSPERQLGHLVSVEAAWSRALGTVGRVPPDTAATAAAAIAGWTHDFDLLRQGTARDGLPVPALVRALKDAAGDAAGAVHAGATSQDIMDTALALTLRETSDLLEERIAALEAALAVLSDRFGTRPLMGRTRMQAATRITAGDRIGAWADPLPRHRARLAELRPRVERLQVGGASGDRAALGADADAMMSALSTELGLAPADRAWHAARDGVAEYASLLSLLAGSCGKIGQDICLMAQQGVEEVELAGGGGSSAMPHKHNPVRAELLVTLARSAATDVSGLHHALVHEQERSGAAWSLEWMILPGLAMTAARALGLAAEVVGNVKRIGSA